MFYNVLYDLVYLLFKKHIKILLVPQKRLKKN